VNSIDFYFLETGQYDARAFFKFPKYSSIGPAQNSMLNKPHGGTSHGIFLNLSGSNCSFSF